MQVGACPLYCYTVSSRQTGPGRAVAAVTVKDRVLLEDEAYLAPIHWDSPSHWATQGFRRLHSSGRQARRDECLGEGYMLISEPWCTQCRDLVKFIFNIYLP